MGFDVVFFTHSQEQFLMGTQLTIFIKSCFDKQWIKSISSSFVLWKIVTDSCECGCESEIKDFFLILSPPYTLYN